MSELVSLIGLQKKEIDQLKVENERLKKGIFKLDKTQPQVILTEGQVSLMYCTFLDMELKTTKLKQTLAEIKAEMRKILMVGNGIDGKYRPVKNSSKQDCYQVLGKIQEILGTNQIKISKCEVENDNA
jgi:hypothetical protein